MKRPGIYCIRNRISKRLYFGHSECTAQRIRQHIHKLRRGTHNNRILQKSWNRHGESAFQFRHIATIADHDSRCAAEIRFISIARASGRQLYNIGGGGEGQSHTEESRQRISKAHAGRPKPYMAAVNKSRFKGKPLSAERRAHLRSTSTGKRYPERNKSPEFRRIMSENRSKRKNMAWSDESKRKASLAKLGKKMTNEARNNMRIARYRAIAGGKVSRQSLYTFNGETHCIKEWAQLSGVKRQTLNYRLLHGWSMERALTP